MPGPKGCSHPAPPSGVARLRAARRARRARTLRRAALCGALAALCLAAFASSAEAAPPTITATWVTDVTATSANLHAEVDPQGLASTYRFEYLSEAAYAENLAAARDGFSGSATLPASGEASLGSGEEEVPALQRLERLSPATSYRYRILATSQAGEAAGPVRLLSTQSSGGGGGEGCANAQLRIEDGSTGLPDCRAWEMVSPPGKDGGAVQGYGANFGGDVLQAAAGGGAITYSSSASFGPEASGAPPASQYISHRGAAGWATQNITAPTLSGAYGPEPEGVPFQLFSSDLSRGLLLDGRRCGEGESCPRSYTLREEGGSLTPILEAAGLRLAGADPGLRHPIFATCAALTPQATEVAAGGGGCEAAATNLYEWGEGGAQLVNILPGAGHGTPGSRTAAQGGAVSADGARVYWVGPEGGLYLFESGHGRPVDESGQAEFQLASADGGVAWFLKAAHLYRYLAATGTATDLTPAGGVVGVLGGSEDGSRVYYATGSGLFLWDEGALTELAAGPAVAATSDYPPTTGSARVSADGGVLAFLSAATLGEVDNTDQASGLPDVEVYLYEAASGRLTCASCNQTGERPLGPSSIPGSVADGSGPQATDLYKPRVLVAGGARLFFDSTDRLVPRDSSAAPDVYEWEAAGEGSCRRPAGCVFLISSGRSSEPSEFIDASADGADAFFLTGDSLAASDPGSVDLYDALEGGGYAVPTPQVPCEGDACQPIPLPPEDPSPGTLVSGTPNPKPTFPKPHHRKPRKHRHKNKGKAKGGPHHKKKSPGKRRRQTATSGRGSGR